MEEVAVVKKRGRPAKSAVAGTVRAEAVPTIPKKRGRPSKAKGRGRPPQKKIATGGSDNDDLDQDELGDANGQLSRPLKIKGRGRPRKAPVQLLENSGSDGDDFSDDEKRTVTKQKSPSSAKRRKLGRPRKHEPSDNDEDDDEEDDRRPVGRPDTGSVKLNISPTGRGVGRPKKIKLAGKRSTNDDAGESNGDDAPAAKKQRGRPPSSKTSPYVPSGRPRGRPKVNPSPVKTVDANEDDDDEGDDLQELALDDSEENDCSADGEAELTATTTPKKRGRPSLANKSVGRPKLQKSTDDDADEQDSAADEDLAKKRGRPSTGKSRGRPKSAKTLDANGGDGSISEDADEDSTVYGGEDSDGPPAAKSKTVNTPKYARKEQKSPRNGDGEAGLDTSEVECISDEGNWPDA